uniref:Fatty acid desaturase domain-containing protein n=1 Tax=Meloidogyne enterolobii TaxID=390850 RepID=A0A6V7U8S1_MELEN|nr:unnamed protein product [Meloidogyne enterolobii]
MSNTIVETTKTNGNTISDSNNKINSFPNLNELRNAIPAECFEKSLIRSLSYLILDFLIIYGLYLVVGVVEDNFGIIGLLLWYWVLGMFLFSIFVVGHDCGHGTFSSYTWVNDLFGHVAHAPTMDMSHPWIPEKLYLSLNWISKHYLKFPLTGFISWIPLYTIFGIPDGSHFWPWSKLFENNTDRIKCVVSVAACFLCAYIALYCSNYNLWIFFKYYYVPVMFQVLCFWLVMITYLQHHDEQTEVYEDGTWGFVRGQLQTVDRSFGFGIDKAMHNITDGHVAHHLFFTRIPHYNLPKATEAVKRILTEKYPGTYKYKKSYDFLIEFLWLNIKLDYLVGKGSGLLRYRNNIRNNDQSKTTKKNN